MEYFLRDLDNILGTIFTQGSMDYEEYDKNWNSTDANKGIYEIHPVFDGYIDLQFKITVNINAKSVHLSFLETTLTQSQ